MSDETRRGLFDAVEVEYTIATAFADDELLLCGDIPVTYSAHR